MQDIYVPTDSWEIEKQKILKDAKTAALQIPKTASVYMKEQDPYPSPYLNLSDYQLPRTMVEIFKWCRYFYKFDSLIGGAVNSLARFPVTDIIFSDMEALPPDWDQNKDSPNLEIYKQVFEDLKIQEELIKIGIDYWLYGNCFIFGELEEMSPDPESYSDIRWARLFRLDPSRVIIDIDPLTQEKTYKWEVPAKIRRIVREKKPKEKFDAIPDMIKKAVKENKSVVLNSKNIYHFSREGESGDGSVWGTPLILNVMKQIAYRNLLRQAQEAIAREHVVPFRIYYLNPTDRMDPQANWNNTAAAFASQLEKAARDPNYKIVSPVPVDVLNMGGQGRALMLTAEIDQLQAEILAGMGVPREFIFGGVSYSAASISLRTLENQFITYRLLLIDFLNNFVIRRMAEARGEWLSPMDDIYLVTVNLADLKMQDDVQQKQMMINLNAANKVSDEYMYNMFGIDHDKMKAQLEIEIFERMERERRMQLYQLETNFLMQQYQMQYQMQLQIMQQNMYAQSGMNAFPAEEQQGAEGGRQQEQAEQEQAGAPAAGTQAQPQERNPKAPHKEQKKEVEEYNKAAATYLEMPLIKLGSAQPVMHADIAQQLFLNKIVEKIASLPEEDAKDLLSKVSSTTRQLLNRHMEKLGGNPHTVGASGARNIALSNMTELERVEALKTELPTLAQDSAENIQEAAMLPVPEQRPQRRNFKV